MKKTIFLLLILGSITVSAQKTIRDDNAVSRDAKGFHGIEVSDGIDLYLSQGNEEAIAVTAASPEYRDKIKTEVRNGILLIYCEKPGIWATGWGNRKLKAYVSIKKLDQLTASGGSDVFIENELNSASLSLTMSGGADFRGKVQATDLTISASGGSDTYISGKSANLRISASGGSDIHAYELISDNCDLQTSGGSDVHITVNKEIKGSVSGGSDVYYKGAANSSVGKSGGGTVKKTS